MGGLGDPERRRRGDRSGRRCRRGLDHDRGLFGQCRGHGDSWLGWRQRGKPFAQTRVDESELWTDGVVVDSRLLGRDRRRCGL